MIYVFFSFKQKTAYEMRISDWSSDVCSSDLLAFWCQWLKQHHPLAFYAAQLRKTKPDPTKKNDIALMRAAGDERYGRSFKIFTPELNSSSETWEIHQSDRGEQAGFHQRLEAQPSALQSLMRISYEDLCL